MLPLLRVSDSIDLVASTDPAVLCKKGPIRWLRPADCKTVKDGALHVTVRPMKSTEVLRLQAEDPAAITVDACLICVQRIAGPGIDESTAAGISDLLDRIPPAELASLGGAIFELSLAPVDPTDASA